MTQDINERVERLRGRMREEGVMAYIIPSTDPHASEYVPEYWTARTWISGFNGSAGTAVVTLNEAALWTDSRYFLAAEEQLAGTPFRLMKDRMPETPSISQWLGQVLPEGASVGIDGLTATENEVSQLTQELKDLGLHLEAEKDLVTPIWEDRPELPETPIMIHPVDYAGQTREEKIARLRTFLAEHEAEGLLLTALDEVAWVLNLRGSDVACTPVFVSYLLVTREKVILYINKVKVGMLAGRALKQSGVEVRGYNDVLADLRSLKLPRLLVDPRWCNHTVVATAQQVGEVAFVTLPVTHDKAIKNQTEIEGFHKAMIRDGVAMVRFLRWLPEAVKAGTVSECGVADKLLELRKEQALFHDISFETIAGYGAHGAIVHYEATPETDIPLEAHGLLLVDSGAQYQDGTTDITRTIALGPLTEEEKRDYTLCLRGHIRLAMAVFPEGTHGCQLDTCARYAMWQQGINYGHGTGHGVGSFLSVHEGPHQLRMNYVPAPLEAGMTVTNEPGIYRSGKHGIRIENTMLVIPHSTTEFGHFLQLEPLTLCPIDTTPIVVEMLAEDERQYLNNYHQMVYARLAPYLTPEECQWLEVATKRL